LQLSGHISVAQLIIFICDHLAGGGEMTGVEPGGQACVLRRRRPDRFGQAAAFLMLKANGSLTHRTGRVLFNRSANDSANN
jgi:hypothetical protein